MYLRIALIYALLIIVFTGIGSIIKDDWSLFLLPMAPTVVILIYAYYLSKQEEKM